MNTDLYVCPICPKQGLHTHWKHEVEHGIRCPCSNCRLFWSKEKKAKQYYATSLLQKALPYVAQTVVKTDATYYEVSMYVLHPSLSLEDRPRPPRKWECELCMEVFEDYYERHTYSAEGEFGVKCDISVCSRCLFDLKKKPTPVDWRTRIKVWHLMLGIPTLFALHQLLV